MVRLAALALAVLLGSVACGVKAPPRPPVDEPELPPLYVERPDGGCCRDRR